ncbi:MAG: hypothetical protein ACYDIE_07835 [Candidatus Krumholzibacteriia bacterium]
MEIVPALREDEPAIVALFAQHRFALERQEWLDWKYHRNPFGGTLSYKILQDGQLAGAVALLPQAYWSDGRRLNGIQAVDGLMGRAIRGKGLFNDVMDFLLRQPPVDHDVPHFYLSFPSLPASVKAHEFAGWHRLAPFDLFTCLLRPRAVARRRGLAWLAPLLTPAWRLGRVMLEARGGRTVTVEEVTRFDDAVAALYPRDRIHGDRSAAFLNWRVFDNPRDDLSALALREGGELAGHVVFKRLGRTLEIMDLRFRAPRAKYLLAILRHLGERDLADSVDCAFLPGHPYRRLLPLAGFFPRGRRGVLFVERLREAGLPADPRAWEIHPLDSDW